jgi:hypothetical protein
MEDFNEIIAEARRQAKRSGMKRADIAAAFAKVRGKR